MKKSILAFTISYLLALSAGAQQVEFEEYDLDNGMHVILHQDNSAPVVITSVMYHVGAKDEQPNRTGMAHFFEHLLFEGTKYIGKVNGLKLCPLTEEITMQIPLTTELIITKFSLQIKLN